MSCVGCSESDFKSTNAAAANVESSGATLEISPHLCGELQSVASLEPESAAELLERLKQEAIPAEARTVSQESGIDVTDIVVENQNYERACDVAEKWADERTAEAAKRPTRRCPNAVLHMCVTFLMISSNTFADAMNVDANSSLRF